MSGCQLYRRDARVTRSAWAGATRSVCSIAVYHGVCSTVYVLIIYYYGWMMISGGRHRTLGTVT